MDNRSYRKPTSYWKDKHVITLKDIRNRGGDVIPKGSICQIRNKYGGFEIRWHYGDRYIDITRVRPSDLDVWESDEEQLSEASP